MKRELNFPQISSDMKNIDSCPRISASTKKATVDLETFKAISEWYHYPIMELTKLNNFVLTPHSASLALHIPLSDAKKAFDRLVFLGILREHKNTFIKIKKVIESTSDLPSFYIRKHHHQMIEKGRRALEEQNLFEREISSMTIAINQNQLPEVKKRIQKFKKKLSEFLDDKSPKDKVYQCNIQFFNLTP